MTNPLCSVLRLASSLSAITGAKLGPKSSGDTHAQIRSWVWAFLAGAGQRGAGGAKLDDLSSSSITDGARIPFRFGADDPQRACSPRNPAICPCPGKNVSPQLAWHNAPAGTKSFAILM